MNTPGWMNDPTLDAALEFSPLQGGESQTPRRADQTRTTCGECHARRLECYPYGPTCVHCLLWGLDCVMPSEEERTLSPESEVILKIEDGLSENEVTTKAEDSPKLRISQAQGASAGSSTGPNSIYVTGNHAMSAQRHALRHRYLAGGRHNCRSLQIDSAKVLSWPVFAGQLDPQAKAMAVLPQKPLEQHRPPGRHQPSVSALNEFLRDPAYADMLVSSFMHNVHVKNPILDVLTLSYRAITVYAKGFE